ncbi:NUDIX hydrolase [Candidatus Parcubacteria bacterium]|nr:NUDIX hydrolase [Candidatus Parcubacteria bacterium]
MADQFSVGVFAVVRDPSGRVLLVQQTYGRRKWSLPGGGLDHGETPTDGVRREVREEAGLEITEPTLVGVFTRFSISTGIGRDLVFVFVDTAEEAPVETTCPEEISSVGFFNTEELPDLYQTQRNLLECVLQKRDGPLIFGTISEGNIV